MPQATLFNPETGQRQAVEVGSQEAQGLFGQGFQLEQSFDQQTGQSVPAPPQTPPPVPQEEPPTPEPTPAPTPEPTPEATEEPDFGQQLSDASEETITLMETQNQALDDYSKTLSATSQSMINNIKDRFNSRRRMQEQINKAILAGTRVRGFTSGRARFAGGIEAQILSNEESAGIARLADLDIQEQQLILEAQNAADGKQFELLNAKIQNTINIQKQKEQTILELNRMANEQERLQLDRLSEARLAKQEERDITTFGQEQEDRDRTQALEQLDLFITGGLLPEQITEEQKDNFETKLGIPEGQFDTFLSNLQAEDDKLLSIEDVAKLGLPFGTTENEAAELGIIPEGDSAEDYELRTVGNQVIRVNSKTGQTDVIFQGEAGADPFTTQQIFQNTFSFRKDFLDESKDFKKVKDSWGRIQSVEASPAGDLSLIFNFMKMLDPGSVVRESEFATAANAAPLLEKLGISFNKVSSVWEGKKLTDGQREDFIKQAKNLFGSQIEIQKERQDENKSTAEALGLDSNLAVPDITGEKPKVFNSISDFITANPKRRQEVLDLITEENLTEQEALDKIQGFNKVGSDTDFKAATVDGNRPQRNNNPGNVKRGGIADKFAAKGNDGKPLIDDQNHLVFPNKEAGFSGLEADIKAKISGRSRHIVSSNPTIAELGKVYAEHGGWANSVARILGVNINTKTQSIDFKKLINAIATQEGFFA